MSDDGPIIEAATLAAHVAGQYARARPPAGKWIAIMQDCLDSLSAATTTEDRQSAAVELAAYAIWCVASGAEVERGGRGNLRLVRSD